MRFRTIAGTDLNVSTVCFGCWAIAGGFNWGEQEREDSIAALRAAFDSGINFFDTAEAYGSGESEKLVADALADRRDDILIATKVLPNHFTADGVREACERSLGYLRTDRIDLYQLHWPNRKVPVDETMEAMMKLKEQGKVRWIGVSNFGREGMAACRKHGEVISNQLCYNLLFRAVEFDIQPACAEMNISILCYSPIMQGLLTGKFSHPDEVPADRARTRHYDPAKREEARHDEPGAEAESFAAVAAVRKIAEDLGAPMADVALAWLLKQPAVATVIAGGRNARQASANAKAADLDLPDDAVRKLSAATDALKVKLGPNADMWESGEKSRIW